MAKENITDTDLFDDPDNPLADVLVSFVVDEAPEVLGSSSNPSTNGLIVANNKPVTIMFSESVSADSDSFEVVCETVSITVTVTSDSGNEEYTLTPNPSWGAEGDDCTLTVVADEVTDADTDDAPDNMETDFVRTFIVGATDDAPTLDSETHEDGLGTFTLVFSEPVDIAMEADDSAVNCGIVTGTIPGVLSTIDYITWTFGPISPVESGAVCNFLIPAGLVTDRDGYVDELTTDVDIDFTIDDAPYVVLEGSTPNEQNEIIGASDTIEIVFSEPVTLGAAFSIFCDSVAVTSGTVTGGGDTYTITPDGTWASPGALCSLTVTATEVSDFDTDDGPDHMVENFDLFFAIAGNVPEVTNVAPSSGSTSGGNAVTITGLHLASATDVLFGSTPASFTVVTPTQIVATAPAGSAGTVNITVTNGGGTSATSSADEYTYYDPPVIMSLTPTAGPIAGGTSVTITGMGFTGAISVKFGGIDATSFSVTNSTEIVAVTPENLTPGIVDVYVETPGGSATAVEAYTYEAPTPVSYISSDPSKNSTVADSDTISISLIFSGPVTWEGTTVTLTCTVGSVTLTVTESSETLELTHAQTYYQAGLAGTCSLSVANSDVYYGDGYYPAMGLIATSFNVAGG